MVKKGIMPGYKFDVNDVAPGKNLGDWEGSERPCMIDYEHTSYVSNHKSVP